MIPLRRPSTLSLVTVLLVPACRGADPPPAVDRAGDPLPELTAAQAAAFRDGLSYFDAGWDATEGLGPLYLQDRCSSCHDLPTPGGSGVETLPKATRYTEEGGCDDLADMGGPLLQRAVLPWVRARGVRGEVVPEAATGVVDLVPPLLYGLGLVEAIPEEALLARADPEDLDGDGISGRVGRTADGRVGRFGRKADAAAIVDVVHGALQTELGITTPRLPEEVTLNGTPLPDSLDPVPDPEVTTDVTEALEAFLRFLAPPPRPVVSGAARDTVALGESLFLEIGCAACHVPALETGPSEVAALDRKEVRLYSDLLLHDMGPDRADVCGAGAAPSELRTERLWGLRHRRALGMLLHDGSAWSVEAAILAHGGEGGPSRDAFSRLDRTRRQALIRFLDSL